MNPILLNYNQAAHDVELSFANKDLALYNNLLTGIKTAIPGISINLAGFVSLLNDPTGYAFDAVVADNPVTIGGAPVSREMAMSLVQIPDSWNTIISLVLAFNSDFQTNTVYRTYELGSPRLYDRLPTANIEIASNVFALTAAYITALTAKYSIYTTSDNQNAVYAILNDIYNSCVQLKGLGAGLSGVTTLQQLGIFDALVSSEIQFNATSFISTVN